MAVGAVFFDVDGTLVPTVSTAQFLGERLGHAHELVAIEEEYRTGHVDNLAVCDLDAQHWAGHRSEEIDGWLDDLPLIDGIDNVVAECRELDLAPFAVVGLAIGVNADDQALAQATVSVRGNDLRATIPHLQRWAESLSAAPGTPAAPQAIRGLPRQPR